MFKSIRSIFLGWHTVILVLVLAGFGGMLLHLQRQAAFKEVDAELKGVTQLLTAMFDRGPRHTPRFLEGAAPPGVSLYEHFDTNRDGRLSANERIVAWAQRFAQLDIDADGQLSAEEFAAVRLPKGPPPPPGHALENLQRRLSDDDTDPVYVVIWRPNGTVFASLHPPADLSLSPPTARKHSQQSSTRQRGIWREMLVSGPLGMQMLVGKSMQAEQQRLTHLFWRLLGTGGGVLALGLLGGWLLAQRVTRPIAAMSATAATISASDLSRRLDITATQSELGQLAQVLNSMFARLEAAFAQQTQFTADASHELRTPVAIMLTQAELALTRERSAPEYREALEACCRAARRMKSLVESLLTLAQIDAGTLRLQLHRFDIQHTVAECAALLTPLATERQVVIRLEAPSVSWVGDADRLAQVLINLMTNAIYYNRKGGSVSVTLSMDENTQEVVLTVADNGVGIASVDLPHIFDRFYRVDKARSRTFGGSGLGLPICQHIIAAHSGTISCQSEVNVGTTFVVRLPAVPALA